MKTIEDFQPLQAQSILRLNCPGFGKSALLNAGDALALTEYKVIIVNPISIVHLFDRDPGLIRQIEMAQVDGLSSCRLAEDKTIDRMAQQIERRSAELFQFLTDGGLLIYYLCRPFLVTGESRSMDNYAWLCGLAPDQSSEVTTSEQTVRHMSTLAHGRNIDKTAATAQSKFNQYFNQVGLEWNTIIRTDFLTNGYTALALAGPKKCIAGELIAGDKGGRVIFLPAPYSPDFDRTLVDSIQAWYRESCGLPDQIPVGEEAQSVDGNTDDPELRMVTEERRREQESSNIKSIVAQQEFNHKATRGATRGAAEDESTVARQSTQDDLARASRISAEEKMSTANRIAAQEEMDRANRIAAGEEAAKAARAARAAKAAAQERLALASRRAAEEEAARAARVAAQEDLERASQMAAEEEAARLARKGAEEDMAKVAREAARQHYVAAPAKVPSSAAEKIPSPAAAKIANHAAPKIDTSDIAGNNSNFQTTTVNNTQGANNAQTEKLEKELDQVRILNNGKQTERDDVQGNAYQNPSFSNEPLARDQNTLRQAFPGQKQIVHETSFKPESVPSKDSDNNIDFASGQNPIQVEENVPIPEWCKSYWLPGMDNLIKEVQLLRKQIKDLEKQLVTNENTILSLEGIKSTLLTGKVGNPLASCKVVLDTLGWRTELSGRNPNELIIADDNHPVAVARIAISQGQSERSELAKLTATLINFWDKEANEPKGILIACTYTDTPVSQRKAPDFPDVMIDFAKRKNVCLISTTQLISIYLEAKLGKGSNANIRTTILSTAGVLPGFTL